MIASMSSHGAMLGSQALYIDPAHRVLVEVHGLGVSVALKDAETGTMPILQNVSFALPQCQMLAIMGGSGAGKTTLLNVLAQRLNVRHATMSFSGSVNYTASAGSAVTTAYMQQEDVFLPGLTLQETLEFQAELRLTGLTPQERRELIQSLLVLLELHHRKDEMVKTFTDHINLSGGEQRRTALAIQLLNKPQLLFLDEPTTGLDTTSALTLVTVLRRLASPEVGITIILSIHQPRAEIAALFDKMCVLTRGGRLVYCGSLSDSPEYFSSLESKGLVPSQGPSADLFAIFNRIMAMLVKNTKSAEAEAETTLVVNGLVNEWQNHGHMDALPVLPENESAHFEKNLKLFRPTSPLPIWREVMVLTRRTLLISVRDRMSLLVLNGGALFLAVCTGWMFYKPTADLAGIRSLTSSLYVMLEVIGFSPLMIEIERLWMHDGAFFFKEYKEQCVTIPGFVISRRLAKLVTEEVPMTVLFACVTYFMWGLRLGETVDDKSIDASYFGIYLVITMLAGFIAMSSAMFCFAIGSDFAISALISNVMYQLQNSGCGYFVNSATMPVYVRWVKYLAYFWYGFGALVSNQYTDWEGVCEYPKGDARCLELTGNYQLKELGYPQNWIAAPIGYLIAWYIGFNLMTCVALKMRNYDVAVAKKRKNKIGGDDEEEFPKRMEITLSGALTLGKETMEVESVSINVEKVTLSVKVKESPKLWARRVPRVLLDNVSASFEANAVNVIMGPSGGGKTTLLNFLASRLSKTSSFARNGVIFLNGVQEVSTTELASISAYVTQHDNLLIPQLTVRETLYYQALLRLPVEEHPDIPAFLHHLLRQTGLLDCADTPVGSALVKGISGGEKRRVSIAIQLLSRPKILFLDEPTSGLDLATSASVIHLLEELADNGTTIIMTIHQPSKEIFWHFENLVLLARGGHVVYDGKAAEILAHLSKLGYPCPPSGNIADFVLDTVSLQLGETKEVSQARVEYLISSWNEKEADLRHKKPIKNSIDLSRHHSASAPTAIAFRAVFSRQLKKSMRSSEIFFARTTQILGIAIIYALFYAPLKNNQIGISNRLGLIQNVVNLFFCGLVNNITIYPSERDLFHQEYKDGAYGVPVFSAAYLLVELPFEIIPCIFFSVLVVLGIGLPRTAAMFFTMLLCSTVLVNTGDSMGIICNSIFEHLGLATNVVVNLLMVAIFMAGTMSIQMPEFFKAWNYINPTKYAVEICARLAFHGQTFSCRAGETCSMTLGDQALQTYGLVADLGTLFGALVACLVVYRAVAIACSWGRVKWFV